MSEFERIQPPKVKGHTPRELAELREQIERDAAKGGRKKSGKASDKTE